MRIRNFSGSKELLEQSNVVVKNPEDNKGKWRDIFNNDNPIHMEIGMGKGNFLLGMAQKYSDINFIGVEQYDTIVARAVKKIEETELENIKIVKIDAIELGNVFDHEIDLIYLTFSDPWPKARHEKRRLTSHKFLNVYDGLFKNDMTIVQKTDNFDLYSYSIESLENYGYKIIQASVDLANSDIPNIKTEYEEKFMNLGVKINYLKAVKNKV